MRLRYRVEAATDLIAIHDYIAADNPVAASAVILRIRQSVERLLLFPKSGRLGLVPGTRELIVPKLPSIVVYQISEELIDIIAVAHAAQESK